ncbi:MAG: hypothetical protein ACK4ND_05740 [Cytophagaceae bacterium]
MKKFILIIHLQIFFSLSSCLYAQKTLVEKDSVLDFLIDKVKLNAPDLLENDLSNVKFQSRTYLGHIISPDSVVIFRLVLSEIYLKNGAKSGKLLVFGPDEFLGFYEMNLNYSKKVMNHKFLVFDIPRENNKIFKRRVYLSEGLPNTFEVEGHHLQFIRHTPFLSEE